MIFGSFFSGIGGAELAINMVSKDNKSVFFCENTEDRYKILNRHFKAVKYAPDTILNPEEAPIFPDITKLKFDKPNNKIFYDVSEDKEKKDYKECNLNIDLNTIDCLIMGFPCQPFSQAGNQLAEHDERYLLDDVIRIIEEISPPVIICENVLGFVKLEAGLETWMERMQQLGWNAEAVVTTSAGVGAPHKRERCFMIAYSDSVKQSMYNAPPFNISQNPNPHIYNGHDLRNPGIEKMVIKIPSKLDQEQLYAIGNSINPFQIMPILYLLKQIIDYHKANPNQNANFPAINPLDCTGPFVERLKKLDIYKSNWPHGQAYWDIEWTPDRHIITIQKMRFNKFKGNSWSTTPVAWDRLALYRKNGVEREIKNLSDDDKEEFNEFLQNYPSDDDVIKGIKRPMRSAQWNEWIQGFPPNYTKISNIDWDNIIEED